MDSILSVQNKILTWDGKKFSKILGAVGKHQKLYIQTTRWNSGKHVQICHGITARQHLIDPNGIVKGAVRRVKEGTSAVLPQSGLDERWWSDSVECYCTRYERRFGGPFKWPIIPCGAMSSVFTERSNENSSIWQESTTWNFSWLSTDRGGNLERRYLDNRLGRIGNVGCIRYFPSNQSQGSVHQPKKKMNSFSQSQMEQQIARKILRIPSTHS